MNRGMKPRTFRIILRRKINAWLKSIDDEDLRPVGRHHLVRVAVARAYRELDDHAFPGDAVWRLALGGRFRRCRSRVVIAGRPRRQCGYDRQGEQASRDKAVRWKTHRCTPYFLLTVAAAGLGQSPGRHAKSGVAVPESRTGGDSYDRFHCPVYRHFAESWTPGRATEFRARGADSDEKKWVQPSRAAPTGSLRGPSAGPRDLGR